VIKAIVKLLFVIALYILLTPLLLFAWLCGYETPEWIKNFGRS